MASNPQSNAEKGVGIRNDDTTAPKVYPDTVAQEGRWTRLGLTPRSFGKADASTNDTQLHKTIKKRHLRMIGIGGCIGAGLFVGSGSSLRIGGPAALLIAFAIVSVMIINVVFALGELAIMYPVEGGFYVYATRFIDPSWGASVGWNYVFGWAMCLPLELTVCAITMEYWNLDISSALWISLFLFVLVLISLFGARGYAEEEFCSALVKVFAITIFIITSLALVVGWGPPNGKFSTYQGGKTWQNPGALPNGARGIVTALITAAFALSGTELVGLAAAEAENPTKALPRAVKQVAWRCVAFYGLAVLFVGLLVPWTDKRLLDVSAKASASPFVIAMHDADLKGLADLMNTVILISVLSVGGSAIYGGSRTLTAMAQQGYAPKVFTRIDRAGRPTWSTLLVICCGGIAYISLLSGGSNVLSWLLAASTYSVTFSWASICVAHIRFRRAWKYHDHSLDEIPYKAPFGTYGSWFALFLIAFYFIAQLVNHLTIKEMPPPMTKGMYFLMQELGLFIIIFLWIVAFAWKRKFWVPLREIDVDTGRRVFDMKVLQDIRDRDARAPMWRKVINFLF